jgi:hypothetical protein
VKSPDHQRRTLAISVAIVVVIMAVLALETYGAYAGNTPERISLPNGAVLCSQNVNNQGPYLAATLRVDAPSSLTSIATFVNGTFEGTTHFTMTQSHYTTPFRLNMTNPAKPIVPGDTYVVGMFATFSDGKAFETVSTLVAC